VYRNRLIGCKPCFGHDWKTGEKNHVRLMSETKRAQDSLEL
jgi:hypothetical protein